MPRHRYILFSEKLNKYYVGSTTDIIRRLTEHNRGKEKFTSTGCPWKLIYMEAFSELADARRLSGHYSIYNLIKGNSINSCGYVGNTNGWRKKYPVRRHYLPRQETGFLIPSIVLSVLTFYTIVHTEIENTLNLSFDISD